uniref:Zinc finger protein 532-like n=1 Tax=Gouania willdenowi TaxID=441366 RepID=A0A8C5FZU7_GOUWI
MGFYFGGQAGDLGLASNSFLLLIGPAASDNLLSIKVEALIMGDMKTPNFNSKVASESGHQDDNAQLKQTRSEMTTSEAVAPNASTAQNIGVSVLVKNFRTADLSEHIGPMSEKHHHFLSHPLSGNGHLNAFEPKAGKGSVYKKNGWKVSGTEGQKADNQLSNIHLYSPTPSAEEFDDDNEDEIVVDDPTDNQENHAAKLSGNNIVSNIRSPEEPQDQESDDVQQALPAFSGLQLFTSTESSVVDAFNKVLSSINPVPVYVPNLSPPSAASISLHSRGFKCLECGDSFALEKSLTQHHERRSVQIEVTCNKCAKSLVFYNKCQLLFHARDHNDKVVVMQGSHLILKPIPADKMISAMNSSGLSIDLTSEVKVITPQTHGKVSQTASQTAVISAPCSAPVVAALPLEDDASKLCRHSLKCLECNVMFQDESSLAMHYQQAVKSRGQKTCTICQMLLPNQCSFLSHQRIHQHKSPYICPECGASCCSVNFQSHVTKTCLHYTRRVCYCCVYCSVIFADSGTFKSHICNTHYAIFYKCPMCPLAFKSALALYSHANTHHPGVKPGQPKVNYMCSMCNTVFTMQSLIVSHLDQHVGNNKVSVFKCPDCSKHFAHKPLMLDHIKAIHGTLKTVEGPPNLGINVPLNTKPTNSMSTNEKEGENVRNEDKGQKKSNSNSPADFENPPSPGYMCVYCTSVFSTRQMFVSHMRREHRKMYPCQLCDKFLSSLHSLGRHNRLKHKGQGNVNTCSCFGKLFAKSLMCRLNLNIPKVYRCAVYNFTTENITAFKEHIPHHKSDGS